MSEVEKSQLLALAETANENHRQANKMMGWALNHALAAGDALAEAKGKVAHGHWGSWLAENLEGSDRSARLYVQLSAHREKIEEAERQSSAVLSISGALQAIAPPKTEDSPRAGHSAEQQAAIEAVEEAHGMTYESARHKLAGDVAAVRDAIEDEAERRQEKGGGFGAEERADYARKLAERKVKAREREARYREERRKRRTELFFEVDARLGRARREAKEALDVVRDVEFSGEDLELLERQGVAAQEMLRLVMLALTGDSGTDWDAELFALEDRREWGDIPPEDR